MIPVELTNTPLASQPTSAAASCVISRASASPCSPVAQLALPELTTAARRAPSAVCDLLTCTGAAVLWFCV